MNTPSAPRTFLLAVASVSLLSFLGTGFWLAAGQAETQTRQHQDKQVNKQTFAGEPVEVSKLEVENKALKPGEKFSGEEEWLRSLSINLKNVSGKSISFIEVWLDFPETKSTGSVLSFPVFFGETST